MSRAQLCRESDSCLNDHHVDTSKRLEQVEALERVSAKRGGRLGLFTAVLIPAWVKG